MKTRTRGAAFTAWGVVIFKGGPVGGGGLSGGASFKI